MFSVTVVVLATSLFSLLWLLLILIPNNNLHILKTKVLNLEWEVGKCKIKIEKLDAECRRLKIKIKSRGGGNPF